MVNVLYQQRSVPDVIARSERGLLQAHYRTHGSLEPLDDMSVMLVIEIANVAYAGRPEMEALKSDRRGPEFSEVISAVGAVVTDTLTEMFEAAIPIFGVLTPEKKEQLAQALANLQEQLVRSGA